MFGPPTKVTDYANLSTNIGIKEGDANNSSVSTNSYLKKHTIQRI